MSVIHRISTNVLTNISHKLCKTQHAVLRLGSTYRLGGMPGVVASVGQAICRSVKDTAHPIVGPTIDQHHLSARTVVQGSVVIVKTFLFHAIPPCLSSQGFHDNLHTVHLGRIEPVGYLVQVTEDSINIVQSPSSLSGVFESVASWRPPPPPLSSSPPFKVQHAGTAGTVVVVVCDSTMVVIEVQERTPLASALQPTRIIGGDDSPNIANYSAKRAQVNELWRGGLDGGPVSALEMGLLGYGNGVQEGVVGEIGVIIFRSLRCLSFDHLQSCC